MRTCCLLSLSLGRSALFECSPLSITAPAHLWDSYSRWTSGSCVLNRDLEYIQLTVPREAWTLPDVLSEVDWLRSRQTLQRNYFPIVALKVVVALVLWLESTFSEYKTLFLWNVRDLKQDSGLFARFGTFKESNGNKKGDVKIFRRLKHPRSSGFQLPALSCKYFSFVLWSAVLPRK